MSRFLNALKAQVGDFEVADDTVPYTLATSLPNLNAILSDHVDQGFAGGRVISISGPASCGKTALATEMMIQAQRLDPIDGFASYSDFEHAYLEKHAIRQGLDPDRYYYMQPLTAEEGFKKLYETMQVVRCQQTGYEFSKIEGKDNTGLVKFLHAMRKYGVKRMPPLVQVIDSIASMIPNEADVDYEDQNMKTKNMALAMFTSTELKRLVRDAGICGSTIVMLNQIRTNPGVMFGDKTSEPGGAAPEFYASVRLRLRRADKLYTIWGDSKSEPIGDVVEVFVQKNKIARPFRRTKYVFRTADPVGLDVTATMVLLGKEAKILGAEGGSTMEFGGRKRWNINEFLAEARTTPALSIDLVKHVMPVIMPSLFVESSAPASSAA